MALTEIGSFDNLDRYYDWKIVLTCTDFTQAESEEFQSLCKANWCLPDDYDLLDPTHRPVFPPRPDPEPPQASPECTIPPKTRGKHRRGRGRGKKSPVPHLVMPMTTFLVPSAVPPLQVLVPVPYLGMPTTSSVISNLSPSPPPVGLTSIDAVSVSGGLGRQLRSMRAMAAVQLP